MTISVGQVAYASDVLALPIYTASDYVLLASASAIGATPSTGYTKVKEITIPGSGALRIKFDLAGYGASIAVYGQVYRNGVAIGTEQSETSSIAVTKSEDISGWYPGDFCQLYTKGTSSSPSLNWKNFKIYSDTDKSIFHVLLNT